MRGLTLIEVLVTVTILGVVSVIIFTVLINLQRAQLEGEITDLKREKLDLLARRIEVITEGKRLSLKEDRIDFISIDGETLSISRQGSLLLLNADTTGVFDTIVIDTAGVLVRLILERAGHWRIINWRR
ncbi:MAG TPA: prepilin-type N-terminal cleavage/methylation domain-containing protein [bacterium (Candidatus Stahlbacteria)]|nr:prepilin-type N-terminal cleavage/methylation domain-containing protein [Candidatus Stahlbacteria bacterium]